MRQQNILTPSTTTRVDWHPHTSTIRLHDDHDDRIHLVVDRDADTGWVRRLAMAALTASTDLDPVEWPDATHDDDVVPLAAVEADQALRRLTDLLDELDEHGADKTAIRYGYEGPSVDSYLLGRLQQAARNAVTAAAGISLPAARSVPPPAAPPGRGTDRIDHASAARDGGA